MEIISLIFWLFALVTCASALLVAFSPRLIHSVFGLFFCFFGVAGLYVILGADFLAATQVILYIGGILVLLVFGVMLTNRMGGEKQLPNEMTHWFFGGILSLGVFVLLFSYTSRWQQSDRELWKTATFDSAAPIKEPVQPNYPRERVPRVRNTTVAIGNALLSQYLVPFELSSIVLLVAMLGAASIARKEVR